jgi:hypothetical protein
MKCPMKNFTLKNGDLIQGYSIKAVLGKCEESECAWWDKMNTCCSMNAKSIKNVNTIVQTHQ